MDERIIEIANKVFDAHFEGEEEKEECLESVLDEIDEDDFCDEDGNLIEDELEYQLCDMISEFMGTNRVG